MCASVKSQRELEWSAGIRKSALPTRNKPSSASRLASAGNSPISQLLTCSTGNGVLRSPRGQSGRRAPGNTLWRSPSRSWHPPAAPCGATTRRCRRAASSGAGWPPGPPCVSSNALRWAWWDLAALQTPWQFGGTSCCSSRCRGSLPDRSPIACIARSSLPDRQLSPRVLRCPAPAGRRLAGERDSSSHGHRQSSTCR